jgi:hypothetical protein
MDEMFGNKMFEIFYNDSSYGGGSNIGPSNLF